MLSQLLLNSASLWGHYALWAISFYFTSVGCRHFNFATGLAFLASPYIVLRVQELVGSWIAYPFGVLCASILGYLYYEGSIATYKHGARPGQLLLISLAALGIGENLLTVLFGPSSRKLFLTAISQESTSVNQALLLFVFSLVGGIDILWRKSLWGPSIQALKESRLNLRFRGFDVETIERTTTILGFTLGGLAGVLWTIDLRIRPSLGFEVCLIGVIAFIVGPMLAEGPRGVLLASLGIVLIRLPLVVLFEGDWEMTSSLILLVFALVARSTRTLAKRIHTA